jgi:DNA-binding transcriptional MocR family regulator
MMEELRTIRDRLGKKLSTLTPEEQQVKINSLDKSDPAKEKPRAPKRASTKAPLPKSQAQRMTVKISALPALKSKLPNVGTTIFSVMSKLAQETGAINLSQGFPDFPIDEKLSELTHAAMKAGHNQYAPMPGLPALRDAIAAKVERLYDFSYDPDTEITVTAGATQALFTALGAIVRPGDEVVIIDPAYDCYAPTVELFGGIPVHVRLGNDMKFDALALRKAVTRKTRVLMINTPHNPAGTILRDADMRAIADILRDTDIILISDEVYEHLVFDGEQHASSDPLSGAARTRFRGLQLRQSVPCHGLENGLRPRTESADGGVPESAPVQRFQREHADAIRAFRVLERSIALRSTSKFLPSQARPLPHRFARFTLRAVALRGQLFPAGGLQQDQRRARPCFCEALSHRIRRGSDPAQPVLQGPATGATHTSVLLREAG